MFWVRYVLGVLEVLGFWPFGFTEIIFLYRCYFFWIIDTHHSTHRRRFWSKSLHWFHCWRCHRWWSRVSPCPSGRWHPRWCHRQIWRCWSRHDLKINKYKLWKMLKVGMKFYFGCGGVALASRARQFFISSWYSKIACLCSLLTWRHSTIISRTSLFIDSSSA